MTRRMFLWLLAAAGFAWRAGPNVEAQDVQYVRAIERAERERPASLGTSARIAPASEPGEPLVVRGQLRTPAGAAAAGAMVFAYHTDRGGLYDDPSHGPHSWRLRGWARTSPDGRFTFETIRPGAYPGGRIPPHVHFTAYFADGSRYHTPQVNLPAARPRAGSTEEIQVDLHPLARDRF
jgi:protocatechuate 3,4-dioxygenase beta subunit